MLYSKPTEDFRITLVNFATLEKNNDNGCVPSGTIMLWSGSPSLIPSGWSLCDGFNGTPDLRDRFVCGAGLNGTEAGSFGEADSHTHYVASQNISVNTTEAGEHGHRLPEEWFSRTDFVAAWGGGVHGIDRKQNDVKRDNVQSDGKHSHSVTLDIGGFETVKANSGKPKWFALCYIMKE